MELVFNTLHNGIRLVHYTIPGDVAYCGLVMNTGSRDEAADQHGMAHFVEHMLFKGTRKRKAYHILSRLDDVGGELNAYTTKEETAVHASFMREHYSRAMELISDIVFNPVVHPREIEKEKDVVLEEINSFLDNPAELIFDEFEEQVFAGQPIGHNILGTPESVRSFSQEALFRFVAANYPTDQMVFCSAGNISRKKILQLFSKYFSPYPGKQRIPRPSMQCHYKPISVTREMKTFQNHCIIGNVAYDLKNKRRTAMFLLNNILGGQGLNSRLNLSLREKKGLAYNIESSYNPYCDTGLFSIYFGTDEENLGKSISLTMAELNKIRSVRLGHLQLGRAKNQIKGYLARGYENHENLMLSLAKSLLVFDCIESKDEIFRKIDSITADDILEAAKDILDPSALSTLIYK